MREGTEKHLNEVTQMGVQQCRINAKNRALEIHMNHLGTIALLAECSLHLSGPEAEELRDQINCCLTDASRLELIKFKRILSSFEVEPFIG